MTMTGQSKEVFKTDKASTYCQSQFRTYEMFGIQDAKYNHPRYLNWDYKSVKEHCDFENKHIQTGKRKSVVVKCNKDCVEGNNYCSKHINL